MTNKLTIIPQQDHGLITEIIDNRVNIITKFDIPYRSISKVIDNETIVTLDKAEKRLLLHTIDGTFRKAIDVPFGITMNVKDHVVYVGGYAREGEVCYMLDLKSDAHVLQNILLPEPMSWGKAVDDILILENKMLLIDNIVYPKYTFEYDISTPSEPKWLKTIELPHKRAYENIIKGDMNEDWMVYLSTSSSGWTGDEAHITIEGKYNNEISSLKRNSIVDICLIGDTLYALTDIGLGAFDLNEKDLSVNSIRLIEHESGADRIIKVDESQILLVSKYGYELLDTKNLTYFKGSIEERFWTYWLLDLSDRELTEFPAEKIKDLSKLEHLDLSNNKIKEFPKALRKCKKLRSLNLYSSGIKKIPSWIEEFEDLEYLNLSAINIDNPIPFMASKIKFPKNLKALNLRYCQLSAIPPNLFELDKLEYLNLLENNISTIPDQIKNLNKLETFKIRWENVHMVSDNIKYLPLESVEINVQNGEIPKVIFLMTNLKRLEAKGADIRKISEEIKNLNKLEYLDLRDNFDLMELPDVIGELKELKTLDISVCGLKKLPKSFCKLTKLEVLHLQHNELTELPDNFGDLKCLRKLDLEGNRLQTLPESFKNLSQLKSLLISRNRLETLPEGIGELQNITKVDLWDNNFSDFPTVLCKLKQLRILALWQNNIKSIPVEIENLSNLSKLDMGDNALTTLPFEIGKLKKLQELTLYVNKLVDLPESIGNLTMLKRLDVSDNGLTALPNVLFSLSGLKELSLRNNQLKELPEQTSKLTKLKKLEIEGNKFTTLPDSIVKLKELEGIDIPDYVFTLTPSHYDWIKELQANSNTVFNRLPLPPSSYMSISERVMLESKDDVIPVIDDNALDILIAWADKNNIDELKWREPWSEGGDGSWDGFPRDKNLILRFKDLNLLGVNSKTIPKELGYLRNLTKLNLGSNELTSLPEEIVNLSNLEFINLGRNPDLKLTTKQTNWLKTLEENGATVWTNDQQ